MVVRCSGAKATLLCTQAHLSRLLPTQTLLTKALLHLGSHPHAALILNLSPQLLLRLLPRPLVCACQRLFGRLLIARVLCPQLSEFRVGFVRNVLGGFVRLF